VKVSLSNEEVVDLISALEMGYDRLVYSINKITPKDTEKCVRFTYLKERLEEYLTMEPDELTEL
jgi:hypothetical protein